MGPDLLITRIGGPWQVVAGSTITLSDTTANQGSMAASAASTTAFYLSTNLGLDAGDTLLGTRAVPALDPGASNAGSITAVLPAGLASGTYYIMAKADAQNSVPESTETNNVSYVIVVTVTRQ